MAWLPGWYYRKQITIAASHVDQALTNFPLRIPLLQTDVIGSQVTGADLRFATSDGTLLNHVWTGFTDGNSSGAYVQIPSIDADTGATIYVYYGNGSATDTSNAANTLPDYAIFWPGDNWTNGQIELTKSIAVSRQTGSATAASLDIGGGVQLGIYDSLRFGAASELYTRMLGETGFICSLVLHNWQHDATKSVDSFINGWVGDTTHELSYDTTNNLLRLKFQQDSTIPTPYMYPTNSLSLTNGDSFSLGHHVMLNGANCKAACYHNGNMTANASSSDTSSGLQFSESALASTNGFLIGNGSGYGPVAIANNVRIKKHIGESESEIAAWLKFEHANLMNTGGEITLAEEESLPVVAGPYQTTMMDSFQTDALQAETYIPGIITGHTYGT